MKFTSAIVVLAAAVATTSAATVGPTAGQDLCCAANQQRARNGLPPLKWLPSIDTAAQRHSEYQRSIGRITHSGGNAQTSSLAARLDAVNFDYRTAAENVGASFPSVDSVTTAWMNSPGHRANILGRALTVCGGGLAGPGNYFTIDFASPMNGNDANSFYTLQCSGSKSLGAYNGNSQIPHKPQTSAAPPKPPVQPSTAPKPPVQPPVAPKPPVQPTAVPKPPVQPTTAPKPPVQPPVSPKPPVQPPVQPGNGKCKLVPKGSIAAGKCKPCKQCGTKASPFRR
ncbi:hypothetical protein GGI20_000627 [Coemansia sp. BCRC 34301]|nr:hypothetical protein GGI20_000627 [Coemansia sp. BCRC 34301]